MPNTGHDVVHLKHKRLDVNFLFLYLNGYQNANMHLDQCEVCLTVVNIISQCYTAAFMVNLEKNVYYCSVQPLLQNYK